MIALDLTRILDMIIFHRNFFLLDSPHKMCDNRPASTALCMSTTLLNKILKIDDVSIPGDRGNIAMDSTRPVPARSSVPVPASYHECWHGSSGTSPRTFSDVRSPDRTCLSLYTILLMYNTNHDIDGIIFHISSLFSQLTNVIEAIKNLRDHSALCPSVKSGTGTGASEISGHLDPSKGSGQEIKIS